jgi:FixJ family two-component response regulator
VTAPAAARVLIVDDDPSVRKSLARVVRAAGYEVEVFASAREFLSRPPQDRPSCLLLDVRMPGMTGLDLQEALATAEDRLSIVFMTGYRDVPVSVKAMKRGAVDFLTKPINKRDILEAIERAVTKTQEMRMEEARTTDIRHRIRTLTAREVEVLALVVTGMLNKQIAAELGVSEKMVKVHRGRVMEKMRAGSLAELVRLADDGGVISPRS